MMTLYHHQLSFDYYFCLRRHHGTSSSSSSSPLSSSSRFVLLLIFLSIFCLSFPHSLLSLPSSLSLIRTKSYNNHHFHYAQSQDYKNPKELTWMKLSSSSSSSSLISLHSTSTEQQDHLDQSSSSSSSSYKTIDNDKTIENNKQKQQYTIVDDISTFKPLFESIINSTVLRGSDTINQGHDSFRYEWGTWVHEAHLRYCMDRINEVQFVKDSYHKIIEEYTTKNIKNNNNDDNNNNVNDKDLLSSTSSMLNKKNDDNDDDSNNKAIRLRIAYGQDWDCLLHILPEGKSWQGRWPTGSWSMLKTLIGMTTISAITGPDQNGKYRSKTKRQLRGGSSSTTTNGPTIGGEDCIKYVGGPLRQYTSMYGKTVLLEVVIRPPIGIEGFNDNDESLMILQNPEEILSIHVQQKVETTTTLHSETNNNGTNHLSNNNVVPSYNNDNNNTLGSKMGMTLNEVGGLDEQLDSIARRVLASRVNPKIAKKFGINHIRGILLSGPPGCGKTLLARELSKLLGTNREPLIVNGPEILDKYIGEAEKKIRELFIPAELEYSILGDESSLHIIIFDEMDSIARKRGTMTSDTTGVRDSVVNQLLAKMDGIKQYNNILIIGLTNRPELLDPALLRPGRLEVQIRIDLPNIIGRRDILRIHTRQMKSMNGLSNDAIIALEDTDTKYGIPVRTEYYSGAELAGLIRSAASFALARTIENSINKVDKYDDNDNNDIDECITVHDLERALLEVQPALGKQDDALKIRYPFGICQYSIGMKRIIRDLQRFVTPIPISSSSSSSSSHIQSLLVVGNGGSGSTALASWAAHQASMNGSSDYVRFITSLDILTAESSDGGGSNDNMRASTLVERFIEAKEMKNSLLVLDDIDQICSGSGLNGYSSIMISTLRALLRSPPSFVIPSVTNNDNNNNINTNNINPLRNSNKMIRIIATTSRSDAACNTLHQLFDETIVVPLLQDVQSVQMLLEDSFGTNRAPPMRISNVNDMAQIMIERFGEIGCKTALRLVERALITTATSYDSPQYGNNDRNNNNDMIITSDYDEEEAGRHQLLSLSDILDDMVGDQMVTEKICNNVMP